MGTRPCTATITTPLGTTIQTSFSPVTNVYSVTITPSLDLFSFCINIPCVSSLDFSCTGNNCNSCQATTTQGVGGNPNPPQPANTTQTYTYTFNSNLTFTAGTTNIDILYAAGPTELGVQLPCSPVCP